MRTELNMPDRKKREKKVIVMLGDSLASPNKLYESLKARVLRLTYTEIENDKSMHWLEMIFTM